MTTIFEIYSTDFTYGTLVPKSENQVQAISVGADDFLMKPLVPVQLQDKLKRLLHRTYGL